MSTIDVSLSTTDETPDVGTGTTPLTPICPPPPPPTTVGEEVGGTTGEEGTAIGVVGEGLTIATAGGWREDMVVVGDTPHHRMIAGAVGIITATPTLSMLLGACELPT